MTNIIEDAIAALRPLANEAELRALLREAQTLLAKSGRTREGG